MIKFCIIKNDNSSEVSALKIKYGIPNKSARLMRCYEIDTEEKAYALLLKTLLLNPDESYIEGGLDDIECAVSKVELKSHEIEASDLLYCFLKKRIGIKIEQVFLCGDNQPCNLINPTVYDKVCAAVVKNIDEAYKLASPEDGVRFYTVLTNGVEEGSINPSVKTLLDACKPREALLTQIAINNLFCYRAVVEQVDSTHGASMLPYGGKYGLTAEGAFAESDVDGNTEFLSAAYNQNKTLAEKFVRAKLIAAGAAQIEVSTKDGIVFGSAKSDETAISAAFTKISSIAVFDIENESAVLAFDKLKKAGKIYSASAVGSAGIAATMALCALGNAFGAVISDDEEMFKSHYGKVLVSGDIKGSVGFEIIGEVIENPQIIIGEAKLPLEIIKTLYLSKERKYLPMAECANGIKTLGYSITDGGTFGTRIKPKVVVPVFGENARSDITDELSSLGAKPVLSFLDISSDKAFEKSIQNLKKVLNCAQMLILNPSYEEYLKLSTLLLNPFVADAVGVIMQNGGLILGAGYGFNTLLKTGLLDNAKPTLKARGGARLMANASGMFTCRATSVKITSNLSPWFSLTEVGDNYDVLISTLNGRIWVSEDELDDLAYNGNVCSQFIDETGKATMIAPYNPTGSVLGIESLCSSDGRVLGTLGLIGSVGHCIKNSKERFDRKILKAGVKYFK